MRIFQRVCLLLSFVIIAPVLADENVGNPYQKIDQVTQTLLATIVKHQPTFNDDPDSYFADVDALMSDLVDFDFIAVNVMGNYRATATEEQVGQFIVEFRKSLVETYGRGLISYSNQTIELLEGEPVGDARKVTVKQVIHGDDGDYPLEYTVARKKDSVDWKVINVVINGINLGKTFRTQFMQAAQKQGGDIDKVIANWSAESA